MGYGRRRVRGLRTIWGYHVSEEAGAGSLFAGAELEWLGVLRDRFVTRGTGEVIIEVTPFDLYYLLCPAPDRGYLKYLHKSLLCILVSFVSCILLCGSLLQRGPLCWARV